MSTRILAVLLTSLAMSVSCAARAQPSGASAQAPHELVVRARPTLDNRLSKCVTAELGRITTSRNLELIEVKMNFRQSIGECGCTSARLSYRVTGSVAGENQQFAVGELNTIRRTGKTEEFYLLLASDSEIAAGAKNRTIALACAAPR